MDRIAKDDLVKLIQSVADEMIAAKDSLNSLDGAIGDGDLGITMTLGFQAIRKQLSICRYDDLAAVFSDCGMAFADNAASTFGALMATMFHRASRAVKGKMTIGPEEGAAILKAAAEGVQKRGNANLGDKTILDALLPAAEAFEKSAMSGQALQVCMEEGIKAAQMGAEQTIPMRSKAGRSGWLGDRTVGAVDPGAAAFVMLLSSATKFVMESRSTN
jgi:phosphoenolpyruvate---glycerone phosphotransferase subunit DhaL